MATFGYMSVDGRIKLLRWIEWLNTQTLRHMD